MIDAQTVANIRQAKKDNPEMFVSGWDAEPEPPEPDMTVPQNRLFRAAEMNDLDELRLLLTSDPSLATARDEDGYTPLHRAAYNDHPESVSLLLSWGADPTARSEMGWVPLHSASRWGCIHSLSTLLQHPKVDVNAVTHGGLTPIHLAAACTEPGGVDVAKMLLSTGKVDLSRANGCGDTAFDLAGRNSKDMALLFDALR